MLTEFQKRHQREYETIVILDPRVSHDLAERVVLRFQEVLTRFEGRLIRVEYWGKRKLSYRIRRSDWGFYYCLHYCGSGGLVAELERNFRMLDAVMRFQSILIKDDIDPATYQVQAAELEFRLDLLAKEAAEPIAEPQADAALVATAETTAPEPPAEPEEAEEAETTEGAEAEGEEPADEPPAKGTGEQEGGA
jgi:small subunit ribosomal protein S6